MNDTKYQIAEMHKVNRRLVLGFAAMAAGGFAPAGETLARSHREQSGLTRMHAGLANAPVNESGIPDSAATASTPLGPSLDRPIIVSWRYSELTRVFAPMTFADGRLYVGQQAGRVTVLDAATGQLVWSEFVGT